MIIVPDASAVPETRHSRELGRKIDQLVREYQRDHPDASPGDVRIALMQMTPRGDSPEVSRRKRAVGVAIAALGAGVFAFMAATGGGRFEGHTTTWRALGVAAAVIGVAIAVIRTVRRG